MKRRLKQSIVVAGLVAAQLAALEMFERFYYRAEDIYTQLTGPAAAGRQPTVARGSPCELPPPPGPDDPLYTSDELGFRTWGVNYAEKCGRRVLFLGSFSMGWGTGVRVHETFSSVFLQRFLELRPEDHVEVINANQGAVDLPATLQQIGAARMQTLVRPDVVVYGLYNPRPDQYRRRRGTTLQERVFGNDYDPDDITRSVNGMVVQSRLPHSDLWYEAYSRSYLAARLLAYADLRVANTLKAVDGWFGRTPARGPESRDFGFLYDLIEYCKSIGATLLVVELPSSSADAARTAELAAVRTLLTEAGVPYLDVNEALPRYPYTWISDGHYSVDSNRAIGRAIAEWADRGLTADLRSSGAAWDRAGLEYRTVWKLSQNAGTNLEARGWSRFQIPPGARLVMRDRSIRISNLPKPLWQVLKRKDAIALTPGRWRADLRYRVEGKGPAMVELECGGRTISLLWRDGDMTPQEFTVAQPSKCTMSIGPGDYTVYPLSVYFEELSISRAIVRGP